MQNRDIDRKARQVLAESGQTHPPVDVEAIAREEGLAVVRQALDPNVSGLLLRGLATPVLGINENHHSRRQRFTIAHELGHWFIHPGRAETIDSAFRVNWRNDISSLATDTEEVQANRFAANLLMPQEWVYELASELRTAAQRGRAEVVTRLAVRFDVSEDAMAFRLHNLGITT